MRRVLVACLLAPLLAACVLPARSFEAYAGKAAATADAVVSAARTAMLTAGAAAAHRLLGPATSIALQEAEEDASSARDHFLSIQPPDAASDALRARLDALLEPVTRALSELRIAARRGELARLPALARPLHDLSAQLERIAERYA
jgi:hypothetical protein